MTGLAAPPPASRSGVLRRLRTDDRGAASAYVVVLAVALLAVAGLVSDAGRALNARVTAVDDAEQAARVGADAIDEAALRAGAPPRVDPVAATNAALDFLAARGYSTSRASVSADADAVTVTVRDDVPTNLLRLVGIRTLEVQGTATARAAVGIESEITGGP